MPHTIYAAAEAAGRRIEQDWGSLVWTAGAPIGNAEGLTLGRVTIRKGCSNPRHAHCNCEEVLYLLAGRLEHHTGDQNGALEPGDTLTVPAGVFHNATCIGGQDADMIVAYSSANRDFVKENRE
ncbi:MAG: cupin domain-containing protein [Kiritimatiellae bacterium]|nr:cupin domain-containing protein [Kiritimatiellia bacterium]